MEIPLQIRKSASGRLSYGIPPWYRAMSAVMTLTVVWGVFSSGNPGVIGWIVIAILALGTLYEERWTVDPTTKQLTHHAGLLPFIKTIRILPADVIDFGLEALSRGTVPGSVSEREDKARAFDLMRGERGGSDGSRTRGAYNELKEGAGSPFGSGLGSFFGLGGNGRRKPYITLVLRTKDGETYLVDTLPARKGKRLAEAGKALAQACGVPFVEGDR